jgi:alpha-beta hydrolase superfamily lysophospholipase
MVDDAISLLDHYQDDLPTVILGHSFGSLLARRLGQQLGHRLAGVIAVSPPPHSGWIGRVGLYAIELAIRFKGSNYNSRFFERLLFGRYNLKFLPATTESDWISSVPEEVSAYLSDPNCGGIPTLGYLHEVARASLDVTSTARIHEHPKTLPMLFVVGADDPVVHDGEGLTGIVRKHQSADIELTVLSYDDARHEILRERQQQDVWTDIGDWMGQTVQITKRTS